MGGTDLLSAESPDTSSLGADIRALRKVRGLTLSGMAQALGRSVGWLSQIERDLSTPTTQDLRKFSDVLDVPVTMLMTNQPANDEEAGFVVRKNARRPISVGKAGLHEELLSPDLTDDFEVVHSTFEPRSKITEAVTRPTQELGYLVSGSMTVEIDGKSFDINAGDSFRIRGEAFRWSNPHSEPAIAIWVIAPPVY